MQLLLLVVPLGYRLVGYLAAAPFVSRSYGSAATGGASPIAIALLRTVLGAVSAGVIAGAVYLGWARAGFDHLDWRHIAPDAYLALWLGRAFAWAVTLAALFRRLSGRAWAIGMLASFLLDLPLLLLGLFGAGVFFVLTHVLGQC